MTKKIYSAEEAERETLRYFDPVTMEEVERLLLYDNPTLSPAEAAEEILGHRITDQRNNNE